MFEVGAAFIVEDRATASLTEIGRAFERLDVLSTSLQDKLKTLGDAAFSGLAASADRAYGEIDRLIAQGERLAAVWGGAGAGLGVGGRGAGTPPRGAGGPLAEDRRNAEAENRNIDQIYRRDEAAARREDDNFNRQRSARENYGTYGPPSRPLWGEGDDWANAHAENRAGPRAAPPWYSGLVSGFPGAFKGMGALGAGFAEFEFDKNAMHAQQDITQTLTSGNMRPENDPKYAEHEKNLRDLSFSSTEGTKFSGPSAAKIMRESLPILQLQGQAEIDAAKSLAPTVLRAAEVSSQRTGADPGHEAAALYELTHLTGKYDAGDVLQTADLVNATARATQTSLVRQEGIDKYALPIGRLLGIPASNTLTDVAAAQARLGPVSTAGTGYSAAFLGAMTWDGKSGAGMDAPHQQSARSAQREFDRILRLEDDPDVLKNDKTIKGRGLKAHNQALVDLGIYDKKGTLLDITAEGNFDDDKFKQQIADYAGTHSKKDITATLENLSGTRGARYLEAYTEPGYLEQEKRQKEGLLHGTTVRQEMDENAKQPLQQFQQVLANLVNTGTILANPTLSGLNSLFQGTNELLIGFNHFLEAHQTVAEVGGWAGLGATVAGVLGVFAWGMKQLFSPLVASGKWLLGAGEGVAGSGTAAAAAGEGAGYLALAARFGGLIVGALASAYALATDPSHPVIGDYGQGWAPGSVPRVGPRPGNLLPTPGTVASASAAAPVINMGGVTVNNSGIGEGDPAMKRITDTVMAAVTNALKSMLGTGSSEPHGTFVSPYTQGAYGP